MNTVSKATVAAWLPLVGMLLLLGACRGLAYDPALFSDDAWIATNGDTYSYVRCSVQHTNQDSGQVQTQGLAIAFSGFYGKHSVWMIDTAVDAMVTADVDIAPGLVGQYKVCLVDTHRQVSILSSGAGKLSQDIQLGTGRYYVVLVGMDASGALSMSLSTTAGPDSISIKAID
jgi:hypothetical protein